MLVRFVHCVGLAAGLAAGLAGGETRAAALSYVSVAGSNSGDCSDPKTPCKTLAYAVTKTSTGGEIKTLLPGDYGPATIPKSLTLTGVPGALVMVGADGVGLTISGNSTTVVSITGFTFNGQAVASIGVKATRAGQVLVKHCAIKNFKNWGLEIGVNGATKFSIEDSFISNVTYGVYLHKTASTGAPKGVVHRSTIVGKGNGIGVAVMGASDVRVSENLIGHFEYGIYSGGDTGNVLRIARNTISQNANGVFIETGLGAKAETAHDNFIAGNTTTDLDPVNGAPLTNVGTQ
ncbi:right-handed parallel beta-helix repeat-containing protein [Methylosinus sp. Sm6]|uniref:right-handed parallel beta-helix repeat-containing protein n=1 Tax=Methylosinus sp. Sm6 TaxID=2866948 RepID=UPI001C992CD9|nr:right-handed parallel beta-helix repeat-containing protein [Methylosinus sp. Sm6]MBY6243809.1 right-handed parallel beta-helix repeat-containing protein [Methylosinus sp. Sm6]